MMLKLLAAAAFALIPNLPNSAFAAASTQTLHAFLCAPEPAVGSAGPRYVTNPATSNGYQLNSAGCGVFVQADVSYFLSQGFTFGAAAQVAQAIGVTGSGTTSVATGITLPAYAQIVSVVLEETAGNAVTGGLNISNAGGATGIASAAALAANATVTLADSAINAGRIYSPSGVPTATPVNLAAVTSWNGAVVNISITYLIY
jgi:hypothetical protein